MYVKSMSEIDKLKTKKIKLLQIKNTVEIFQIQSNIKHLILITSMSRTLLDMKGTMTTKSLELNNILFLTSMYVKCKSIHFYDFKI